VVGGADLANQLKQSDMGPECLISLHWIGERNEIRKMEGKDSIRSIVNLRAMAWHSLSCRNGCSREQAALEEERKA